MLSSQKASIEKYFDPITHLFRHTNPNVITLLGSIPSLLFFVCILNQWYLFAIPAFIGNLFDFIDGMVARKFNKVTPFGALLDSTLDRVADFLLISAFAFGNIVRWEIAAPVLLVSFLISYIRGTSEKMALANNDKRTLFNIGIIERTERLGFIFIALLAYVFLPHLQIFTLTTAEIVFIVLLIFSCHTVVERIQYAYKNLRA
jgi:CDP-diacylglycerol---glycerol-3-phosphate 3-phosphatidyltransferase